MEDDPGLWLAGFIPFSAYGWLLILSLPTGVGAVALLFARKLGIFISLALLPLLAITLGMSVFSILRDPQADMITKVLIDLSIASVMTMLGPLMLGWKRVKWKSAPTRRRARERNKEKAAASARVTSSSPRKGNRHNLTE
jgi:hypothetical protein